MKKRISFTKFQADAAAHLDLVEADGGELIVTRKGHEPVAVIRLDELEGLRETLHLLSSPANAERLLRSIREIDAWRANR